MPAWITSLLREDVSVPIPSAASRMITSRPAIARARATARPTTPAPTTTQSTSSTPFILYDLASSRHTGRPGQSPEKGRQMLTLIAGESRVVVAPEAGGGIVGWVRGGVPILRPAQKAAEEGNFHAMACFPLLPYANRIGNGRFTWNGHAYQLPLNSAPHSIHGIGRERPWQIDQSSLAMLALSLHHAGDATWPFAFDATLGYRLDDDGLTMDLAITNKA